MTDIIFVHLLNDSSGSPKVLFETIKAFQARKFNLKLYVSSDGNGILSNCTIPICRFPYYRSKYRVFTLFTLLISQVFLFFHLLHDKSINSKSVIFVNTLLPFGAALFGKFKGIKVIYHIHEISLSPGLWRRFLKTINRNTSVYNIYVSGSHRNFLPICKVESLIIYNSVSDDFIDLAIKHKYEHRKDGIFRVLLIANLRDYKGVVEFVKLAAAIEMDSVEFTLLANEDQSDINIYFNNVPLPKNIKIYSRVKDVTPFYRQASLVLNLSRVDLWIETFGLTILEAMAFGIPVIVPPIGGPAEIVADGIEGFQIDSRNHTQLVNAVSKLAIDEQLCLELSDNGRKKAKTFSPNKFSDDMLAVYTRVKAN